MVLRAFFGGKKILPERNSCMQNFVRAARARQTSHFAICMVQSKSKYWCFTLNNYTEEEEEQLKNVEASYIVYGKEVGENSTKHLQGYVEFPIRKTLSTIKKIPGFARSHLEVRRGTAKEASEYCKKEEGAEIYEKGSLSLVSQGHRSDLDKVIADVKAGMKKRELWETHPKVMIRYHRSVEIAIEQLAPRVERPVFALESFGWSIEFDWDYSHILWGESGIGKTCYARAVLPGALLVSHMDDLARFDPDVYTGIIFDDMSFLHMPRTGQIHLVDQDDPRSIHIRYACARIPEKTKKIFTTNEEDGKVFDLEDGAIKRRVKVHHIINL